MKSHAANNSELHHKISWNTAKHKQHMTSLFDITFHTYRITYYCKFIYIDSEYGRKKAATAKLRIHYSRTVPFNEKSRWNSVAENWLNGFSADRMEWNCKWLWADSFVVCAWEFQLCLSHLIRMCELHHAHTFDAAYCYALDAAHAHVHNFAGIVSIKPPT